MRISDANAHIDRCLAKSAGTAKKKQRTMRSFLSARPGSEADAHTPGAPQPTPSPAPVSETNPYLELIIGPPRTADALALPPSSAIRTTPPPIEIDGEDTDNEEGDNTGGRNDDSGAGDEAHTSSGDADSAQLPGADPAGNDSPPLTPLWVGCVPIVWAPGCATGLAVAPGARLVVNREPQNAADRCACAVLVDEGIAGGLGAKVAYVRRHVAAPLSRVIDAGGAAVRVGATAGPDGEPLRLARGAGAEARVEVCLEESDRGDAVRDRVGECLGELRGAASGDVRLPGASRTDRALCAGFKRAAAAVLGSAMEAGAGHTVLDEGEVGTLRWLARRAEDDPALVLLLRMAVRDATWLRRDSLAYIEGWEGGLEELTRGGLLEGGVLERGREAGPPPPSALAAPAEWLRCLRVGELCRVLAAVGEEVPRGRKADVVRAAEAAMRGKARAMWREAALVAGPMCCVAPRVMLALRRLERLYFGNEEQGLKLFTLAGVGVVRYPAYEIEGGDAAPFRTRREMLAYEAAHRDAQDMEEALTLEDTGAALQMARRSCDAVERSDAPAPADLVGLRATFSPLRMHTLIAHCGVSLLEKEKQYAAAVATIKALLGKGRAPSKRGHWWMRLCVNLGHLGRQNEALLCGEAGLRDPWVTTGELHALRRLVLRLSKPPRRWRVPAWAASFRDKFPEDVIALKLAPTGADGRRTGAVGTRVLYRVGEDDDDADAMAARSEGAATEGGPSSSPAVLHVEEAVLQHYAGDGWRGWHSEGGIWSTLFGLLMWDVVFAPGVPGAFRHPFQAAPLDLGGPAFAVSRKRMLDERLAEIENGGAAKLLEAAWRAHHGEVCRGVSWDRLPLEDLLLVCRCFGGGAIAAVCRILAQDYNGWRGGMPDLVVVHPGRALGRLVEVKSHNDQLSDQQRAWLAELQRCGVDARVQRVRNA
ncbi:unnamed protein product [Pedinophyceae sp. YPF-701]|nr:unnamed protein product [Pedinophyceae sp. YPF-701]